MCCRSFRQKDEGCLAYILGIVPAVTRILRAPPRPYPMPSEQGIKGGLVLIDGKLP